MGGRVPDSPRRCYGRLLLPFDNGGRSLLLALPLALILGAVLVEALIALIWNEP